MHCLTMGLPIARPGSPLRIALTPKFIPRLMKTHHLSGFSRATSLVMSGAQMKMCVRVWVWAWQKLLNLKVMYRQAQQAEAAKSFILAARMALFYSYSLMEKSGKSSAVHVSRDTPLACP